MTDKVIAELKRGAIDIPKEMKFKMAIVFRGDLKLSKAKMAVQAAHAALGACWHARGYEDEVHDWFMEGQRKIILKVSTEKDIQDLANKVDELLCPEYPYYIVADFGLTELAPQTITCIAIGPGRNEDIDKITKRLKLYKE